MILQRQMVDVMLLGQLAAASFSPPDDVQNRWPPTNVFSPSTVANHRRLSLDNYVGLSPAPATTDNRGAPAIQTTATDPVDSVAAALASGLPPSWLTCQTVLNRLLSSSHDATSNEEFFRTRSMSLGSAASRSMDSCSGSSSPGPTSPTNAVGLSTGSQWAGVVGHATTVSNDSHRWFDSLSPSTSWPVPDSPTSFVGSGASEVASSSFYASCSQITSPNRVISNDKQSAYPDGRRQKFRDTLTGELPPNCVSHQRVPLWPIC